MSRKIAIGVVAAATTVGVAYPFASAASDGHDGRAVQLLEKVVQSSSLDLGAPGTSLGDRYVFAADLFDSRRQVVGSDGGSCEVVRLGTGPEESPTPAPTDTATVAPTTPAPTDTATVAPTTPAPTDTATVAPTEGIAQCTATLSLQGGQLTAIGLVPTSVMTNGGDFTIAVVGGTGRYTGIDGTLSGKHVDGDSTRLIIRLNRR
jgi:hypothetical protein